MVLRYIKHLNFIDSCVVVLIIVTEILASEIPRPRGVSLSRVALYDPSKDFTCFDGTLTIPFDHVNDDFCDCPDASDEPGTSACPHGIFHCTNSGHRSLNILSSRVNDGVCDCCDTSDEYANNRMDCVNNCFELGRNAREEALRQAEVVKVGNQLRLDLSQKGVQLKQQKKQKLVELQKNKDEAEKIKQEKESLKQQAESLESVALEQYKQIEAEEKLKREQAEAADTRTEAIATFNKYDSNQDSRVDVAELQTRQTFDKDRNGVVSEEEAKFFLNEQDSLDLEDFVSIAWPRIKPFLMLDAGLFKPPGKGDVEDVEQDVQDVENEPDVDEQAEDGDEPEEDAEAEGEEDEDADDKPDEPAPATPPKYDEETQKLVNQADEARNNFETAQSAVRDIDSEISNIEEYLNKDFGPEEEFATLEGQCFEYSDHEYIYKLCPFDKTVQQPKSNSLETRLGTWSHWDGTDDNKYDVMMYDRGQSCWNGPQRNTRVRVSCGSDNVVTAVSEPNRCEYMFDFTTPAACREIVAETDEMHDEL